MRSDYANSQVASDTTSALFNRLKKSTLAWKGFVIRTCAILNA